MTNVFEGQTVRVTVSGIVDSAGQAIPSPTVTITLVSEDGTETAGSVTQSGSSYYAEFTPSGEGVYHVKAQAVKSGSVWRDRETVLVKDY